MSIHHVNPLLISWDPESGCFLVSDFGTKFKPIKTEESLGRFIREYHSMAGRVEWNSSKLTYRVPSGGPSAEEVEAWLAANRVEKPLRSSAPISLDDLLS